MAGKNHRITASGKTSFAADLGADYDADEVDFLRAMDEYILTRRRPFPTFTEVLAVLKSQGWRRTAAAGRDS